MRKLLIIYSIIGYNAVGLTACSFIPEYFRPQPPVANEYPKLAESEKPTSVDSSVDIQWQQIYTDKRLQLSNSV